MSLRFAIEKNKVVCYTEYKESIAYPINRHIVPIDFDKRG